MAMELIQGWAAVAKFVASQAILVGVLIWLYHAAYDLATRKNWRRATLSMITAGGICFALGAISFRVSVKLDSLLDSKVPAFEQPSAEWGADLAPEERERSSRTIAGAAFREAGHRLKYVDQTGVWREYCPTAEDRSLIAEKSKLDADLRSVSESALDDAIRMWSAGCTALVFGFAVAAIKRGAHANGGR